MKLALIEFENTVCHSERSRIAAESKNLLRSRISDRRRIFRLTSFAQDDT